MKSKIQPLFCVEPRFILGKLVFSRQDVPVVRLYGVKFNLLF